MMYKEKNISGFQFACLAFTSRIVCAFTGIPNLRIGLPASDRIAVFLLGLLFSLLFAIPVLLCMGQQNDITLSARGNLNASATGRLVLLFYAFFFTASGIIAVSQFGLFASGVLLQKENLHLFIAVLIAAAAFCAQKGLEPTARVGVLLSIAVVAGLLFIGLFNAGKVQPENLSRPFTSGVPIILREAFFEACMNAELLLLLFLAPQIKTRKKAILLAWIPFCFVSIALAFTLAGAITGHYGDLQTFPLHTLAVLAKTKLFERIDDMLAGLWVVCTVLKTGLFLHAADAAVQSAFPKCGKKTFLICADILVFGGYLLLSDDMQRFADIMKSASVPILFILAAVIIPLCVYLSDKHKNHKRNKEESR